MLERLGTLFLVALASAVLPVLNLETYLAGWHLFAPRYVFLSALVAAVGQTIGKFAWYEAGHGADRLPWLGRKLSRPKAVERTERWQARLEGHPVRAAGVLFAASTVSLPPLFIMAAVAGYLRMHRGVFAGVVFVGRCLRFWSGLSLLELLR